MTGRAAAQRRAGPIEEGEIIVTATKRAGRVQDVPFSINAQTQADLQRANAQTLEDISRNVAGLTVQNLGPGQSQVSVRGVSAGQIARDQPGVKEQVGIYLDESDHLAVAVHARFRPVRPQPRRNAARPAGHVVRRGQRRRHHPLHHQPAQPRSRSKARSRATSTSSRAATSAMASRARSTCRWARPPAVRVVGYGTHFGGFIDSVGPYDKKNVNDGSRIGGRVVVAVPADARAQDHAAHRLSEGRGRRIQPRGRIILFNNQFMTGGNTLGKREQYLLFREKFRDKTMLADLVASYDFGPAELTSRHQLRQPQHPRQPRRLGTDRLGHRQSFVGYDEVDPVARRSPLRSRRTCATRPSSSSSRRNCGSASTGAGPFQWVFGGFYSDVDRKYAQTAARRPGLTDLRFASTNRGALARSSRDPPIACLAAAANGFPAQFAVQRRPALRHQAARRVRRGAATSSASSS